MNSLLTWRAGRKADRAALQAFCCTEPPTRSLATRWRPVHPKRWEFEVQSAIRTLRPPCRYPYQLLLGEDADGIAAVSYFEELDGPGQVSLELMAIARRLRGKGGGYADEMFTVTLDLITERAIGAGVPEVLLTGYVFEQNRPSQALCRRQGLRHTGEGGTGVQVWSGVVPISGA